MAQEREIVVPNAIIEDDSDSDVETESETIQRMIQRYTELRQHAERLEKQNETLEDHAEKMENKNSFLESQNEFLVGELISIQALNHGFRKLLEEQNENLQLYRSNFIMYKTALLNQHITIETHKSICPLLVDEKPRGVCPFLTGSPTAGPPSPPSTPPTPPQ